METWDEKRARFEHRCDQCQTTIARSETYTRHQVVLLKTASIAYVHKRCVNAYKARIGRAHPPHLG